MQGAQDISWIDLAVGYLLLIIPVLIFRFYQTGMIRPTLIAVARMTVQLILVGLYLQYIFDLNSAWVNILWVVVMIVVASFSIISRSGLNRKLFLFPILAALLMSIFLINLYLLGVVIRHENLFDARYFIPITGMLIGNSMSNNIIAMSSFYQSLDRDLNLYKFSLANGGTRTEALRIYMAEALQKALNPLIATTAVVGLISLPGMMTGQILGGSDPAVAIKYQIMIMVTILVSSVISIVLAINLSNRFIFDAYDMPARNLIKSKK